MSSTDIFAFDGILDLFTFPGQHPPGAAHPPASLRRSAFSLSRAGMNIVKAVHGRRREAARKPVSVRSTSSQRHVKKPVDNADFGRTRCRRIVLLGAQKVGKTNLLQRFLGEDFKENYEPTREDFHRKLFRVGGETYRVDVLDAACERMFPAKRRLSILTGDIFLLVFSLDNRESFREACELLSEIKSAKTKFLKLKTPARVPVVVCGNKTDLVPQRVVDRSEVLKLFGDDVSYVETSAMTGAGLDALFGALARVGGLPEETSPSRHDILSILSFQTRAGTRAESAPCGAVDPLARRPSFTTELKLVLGSSATQTKPERCQIQ